MMNLGDLKPKNKKSIQEISHTNEISFNLTTLVDTEPDDTQYQIINLMQKINYRNVAILNLSDIRDTESSEFVKQIDNLNHEKLVVTHSIFSKEREEELSKILPYCKDAQIIIASGVNYKLRFLTNHVLSIFKTKQIFGVKKENQNLYYHPLPRNKEDKENWLDTVYTQLKDNK